MEPRAIDIHTHVQFAAYDGDRELVVKRALSRGVWMINVGTQMETSKRAVELSEKFDEGVYATVGLHPIHTDKSFIAVLIFFAVSGNRDSSKTDILYKY